MGGLLVLLAILGYVSVAVVGLFAIFLLLLSAAIIRTEHRLKGIPAPKRTSFFLGNMRGFFDFKEKTGLSTAMIMFNWSKEAGPVFWMRYLHLPFVLASSPEVIKELLLNSRHTKPANMYQGFQYLYGSRFMGHGLVSELDHESWFHKRAIMNPAFRRKYLVGMMDTFNDGSEALCQKLLLSTDGKTEVAMLEQLNNVTLDVIAKTAFSMDTDAMDNPNCPFPSAITTMLQGLQHLFDKPFTPFDPRSASRKMRREVRQAISLVRETGRKCVKERIDARQNGDHVPNDILNVILTNSNDLKEDDKFNIENVLDEFLTLFVAGQETTSNLLAFTIQQLGRYPDVYKKLQAEVDEVLGQKPVIQFEDLANLEYMMLVFKETLRLYPPVGGTSRVTAHPIKYKDITIPAGTTVSVLSNIMARMEEYFDDPLLFNPDRFKFSKDGKLPRHLYAYFPFSMGQRSCIGQQFALIEARVLLGKLMQRFDIRWDQSQRLTILDELTAKPMDKCKVYITLRA